MFLEWTPKLQSLAPRNTVTVLVAITDKPKKNSTATTAGRTTKSDGRVAWNSESKFCLSKPSRDIISLCFTAHILENINSERTQGKHMLAMTLIIRVLFQRGQTESARRCEERTHSNESEEILIELINHSRVYSLFHINMARVGYRKLQLSWGKKIFKTKVFFVCRVWTILNKRDSTLQTITFVRSANRGLVSCTTQQPRLQFLSVGMLMKKKRFGNLVIIIPQKCFHNENRDENNV